MSKQKLNLEQNITSLNIDIDILKKFAKANKLDYDSLQIKRDNCESQNKVLTAQIGRSKEDLKNFAKRNKMDYDSLQIKRNVCEKKIEECKQRLDNKDKIALIKKDSATPDSTSPSTELGVVRNSLLEKIPSTDNKDEVIVDTIDPTTSKETELTAVGINPLDSAGNPPPISMKLEIEQVRANAE